MKGKGGEGGEKRNGDEEGRKFQMDRGRESKKHEGRERKGNE